MFVKIGHAKAQWKAVDYQATARTMRYLWFIILELYLFAGLLVLLFVCFHFGWLRKEYCNVLLVSSITSSWPTSDLSHRAGNEACRLAALPLTKPWWISAFLPHDSGIQPTKWMWTHNRWTIQTLERGPLSVRDKNQQASSWASHSLSGNLGRNLSEVPMELNLYLLQKQTRSRKTYRLCHSSPFPHSCLEGSLSKWNTCTWPLSQGQTNQDYRNEAGKQTLRWRLWHWITLMPIERHC